MNKIGLIIAREYIARVKKKSFIIMTILGPVLFAGMISLIIWMTTREGDHKLIQVIDESGLFETEFESTESTTYRFIYSDLDETKKTLLQSDVIFGLLYIPNIELDNPKGIRFYSTQNPGITMESRLIRKIKRVIEDKKLINSGIDEELLASLETSVEIRTINLSETGDESESDSRAAIGVGYFSSFLLYMFIFLYGAQIMRGIIEEKTSRIIEVVIASVKPFHLMMGKIFGIAAVGLTQFVIWTVMSTALTTAASSFLIDGVDTGNTEQMMMQSNSMAASDDAAQEQSKMLNIMSALDKINVPLIVGCFLFYFLGGYLLYGALFAAVGSAVDSDADSQQFMLPITLPLIFSMMTISIVIQEPHGTLAFWLSIVPFTAPVIMMMRLPFDVPTWEIAVSMVLLIVGFCATTWFASRIYRIGIFMHGTKVNYKTIGKWFLMKI